MPVSGTFNLTDGLDPSFAEIENAVALQYGKKSVMRLPYVMLRPLAFLGDIFKFLPVNSKKLAKLTTELTFSCAKAIEQLNWHPQNVIQAMQSGYKD